MKTFFLFLSLISLYSAAGAQDVPASEDSVRHVPDWNVVLSQSAGNVFLNDPGAVFSAHFIYTSVPASGTPSNQLFNGSGNGSFTSNMFVADILNIAFSNERNSVNFGMGAYNAVSGNYAVYVKGGYSFVTPVNRFLVLKPGANLLFLFSHNEQLGSIDNYGKKLYLLGVTSGPEFTINTDSDPDDPVQNTTFETDHLKVEYARSNLIFEPKVTLSTKPLGRFIASVEGGWFIQVFQSNGILLTQVATDGKNTNSLGKISFGKNGNVNGPYIGVSIGMIVGHAAG